MRKVNASRGSILIWTLLMGIALATVFFFFAQRLGANVSSQRETMEYQNAKLFLESYVAYLQGLDEVELESLRGEVDFMGISGTLTNVTEEITGVLDSGKSIEYSADIPSPPTDYVKVEWDSCPADVTEVLEIDGSDPGATPGGCAGLDYDKAVSQTTSPFVLSAIAAPTSYRLTPIEAAILYDKRWKLDLSYSLGFRKRLTSSITFIPKP